MYLTVPLPVVGLAPVFVSVFQGRGGRAVRIAAIPVFWLGAWVTIMSLHGKCQGLVAVQPRLFVEPVLTTFHQAYVY